MDREFDFRAWHKSKKHMYYNVAIGVNNKIGYRMNPSNKSGKYVYEDGKEVIINPYIGAKNKSGKKIYVGDILEIGKNKSVAIVEWDKDKLCYILKTPGGKTMRGLEDPIRRKSIKIVGNIYENTDLLKK